MPATIFPRTNITLNGSLSDWSVADRIDYGNVAGYSVFARAQGDAFYFALGAPIAIGATNTVWFNTDQNAATGYQIFPPPVGIPVSIGGAEYSLEIGSDGTATLYQDGGNQTLVAVLSGIQLAYSADQTVVEFAVPAAALGSPTAIDTLYAINNTIFLPIDYTSQPYVALAANNITSSNPATRIGIVYSDTTAANYFSPTAYADLVMAAQTQAMQAGVPYDLLTEADLKDISKLANYDALVFPSFTNVQTADATAITNTLLQATREFGVSLITSGDFMTNSETGAALGTDPYARMKVFFDATRQAGDNSGDVTVTNADPSQTIFGADVGDASGVIRSYTGVGWAAYQSVSGAGQVVATQTVGGQTYAAVTATQGLSGGKNVLFSSNGVMADSNLLGQAIDYVAKTPGISLSLGMTRFKGMVGARMDMDQSQFPSAVLPDGGAPGIYDKLIPILQTWKQQYNFTGSYYISIGDNPTPADPQVSPSTTDWAKSLPYYQAILAMGGEIGNHSRTHLINQPATTFPARTTAATAAGATQITLDSVPSFAGVTVGMIVSGAGIGVNTIVTAVSGNTITISYVPQGFGTPNVGTQSAIPQDTALTFSLPTENTNFLETGTGTVLTSVGNPFTYDYEFNASKLLLQQHLGVPIYGAAVPGAGETYATALNILQYYQSVAATATTPGYTGYVTGGWTGVGSGFPSAFGYMNPTATGAVYLAPNVTFDFTEIQYQGKSIDQAKAAWAAQVNDLAANTAGPPILVWPIHDYGAAAWDTVAASPYTTDLFTYFIELTYNSGYEFVTLADLASRIDNFAQSDVASTVNGNIITASVTSPHAGDFALDVEGQGSQVIQNVAGWYAYDADSVFLPETGGNFTITLGAAADDVTHITALPMRGELLSVAGDGRNLSFSMIGDGNVVIDLGPHGSAPPVVTGATIASLVGDRLELTLTGLGRHDVTVSPASSEFVSAIAFSADSGASGADFVTNVAAQTITGTLSAPLAAGNVVRISLDNGLTWLTAAAAVSATTFSLAGVTLSGSNTLIARVENSSGLAGAALVQAYVLDQTPPTETAAIVVMTKDSGTLGDFVTNDGSAGRTVSGILSAPLAANESLQVSFNNGATWLAAVVTGTAWSATDSASHDASWTIQTRVVDLAGNPGPITSRAVVLDGAPPVTGITASPADAILGAGATATLTVSMGQAVTVSGGTPTLALNNGAVATYTSGSGTNALTFSYTVAPGQDVNDLAVAGVNLNGAVVTNQAGTAADFTQAAVNPAGWLQIAPSAIAAFDTGAQTPVPVLASHYTGPVPNVQNEYINISSQNLNVTASTPNWFIHSGSGMDAITVSSGTNVLDGGTGSNFLVGGSGTDTFFVDDRGPPADIWSTIVGFHQGDAATIWGITPQDFELSWVEGQGANGYTGLTLHATAPSKPNASLTLTGYTQADLSEGRLAVQFGTDTASGSAYMHILVNA